MQNGLADSKKKVLIISYVFPPMHGVGGRRWAKFSKYLLRQGVTPIVVSASNSSGKISTYLAEVADEKIIKYQLPHRYFKYILFPPKNVIAKFISKIQYAIARNSTKGNYFDRSMLWKNYFENEIPNIIRKHNVQKVIISGAPFHYFKYALLLKKNLDVEIILDYRDPWSDFNIGYDNPEINQGPRHIYELELEKEVLRNADKVICVSEYQRELLRVKVPDATLNIQIVRNGFDNEDFVDLKSIDPFSSEYFNIVHFGTLNYKKGPYINALLQAIKHLKETHLHIYAKVKVHFVGPIEREESFNDLVNSHGISEVVINHGAIDHKHALEILNKASICLWFKFDQSPGDYATKFYEYVKLRKFMWVFTIEGTVADFVSQNKIGKIFFKSDEKLNDTIYSELIKTQSELPEFNPHFNVEQFSIDQITKELIQVVF